MGKSIDQEVLEAFFEDARDVLEEWERFCLGLKSAGDVVAFEPLLRCAHNLKGSAGLAGLPQLHAKLHQIEDFLVRLRDRRMGPSDDLMQVLLEVEDLIRRWVEAIKTNPEFVLDSSAVEAHLNLVLSGAPLLPEAPTQKIAPTLTESREGPKGDETLRVSAAKLDRLIQLVGEISLHQSILVRASRENTLSSGTVRAAIDLKSKITQDLQDAALSLRMIPVEGLFQKIERVARETASRQGKSVQVLRLGDDVALDKLIVEGMLEPLIHIARNAVDHGIENSEERKAQSKPVQGLVRLIAENTSTGVSIIFEDDGRGIDPERVYRKAIEKELIAADEALSPGAKLQLIFLPGLSTAEQITEISGRGVGMDVVADTVKQMAGQLEIESEIGKGTRIKITLPTNLSIVDALVVKVDGCHYAIPNQDLAEVIDLRDFHVSSIDSGQERAIDLRGRVVPVAGMGLFLSGSTALQWAGGTEKGRSKDPQPALVVKHRDEQIALAVDAVAGQQQIFVRPLIGHLAPVSFFSGSTILSDGEPSIILSLSEMARRYFTSH